MLRSPWPVLPTLDQEDCFRQAVQKWGAPEAVCFDTVKQVQTKWMARTCSKLGTRLFYAKPYTPGSRGKIERFNRVVDGFLHEVALEKLQTLKQLNQQFEVWLSECYQNKPHPALGEHTSPEIAYRSDRKILRFVDAEQLRDAFLHVEIRKVDESRCISFMNRKYEVGLSFIECLVDVIYDPTDTSVLTIEYEGHEPWKAYPLVIGEQAGKQPAVHGQTNHFSFFTYVFLWLTLPPLPIHFQQQPTGSSRLLTTAEQKHRERNEQQAPAVSYRAVWRKGNSFYCFIHIHTPFFTPFFRDIPTEELYLSPIMEKY